MNMLKEPVPSFKIVAGIFLLGFAARAAFTLIHGDAPLVAEMNAYWEAAGGLLAGVGYHTGHGTRAFLPPGYPFFLAAVRALHGDVFTARIVQAALGGLTAVLTYLWARPAVGEKPARWTGFALALWPPALVFSDFLLSESLYPLLLIAGLTFWGDGRKWSGALAAAFTWGFAAYTREYSLYFFPVIAGWNILARRYRPAIKAVVAAFVVAACVTPWALRNRRVLGGFVPVTTKNTVDFYLANHNNFEQILYNISDQPSERALFGEANSELDLYHLAGARATEWIVRHPALFVFKGFRNLANFLRLERDFFQHQMYGYYPPLPKPLLWLLAFVFLPPTAVAMPLAFVGALRAGDRPRFAAAICIIAIYVAIAFVAYGYSRHRFPLTPIMLSFAAVTLADLRGAGRWLKERWWAVAAATLFGLFLAASWGLDIYLDLRDFAGVQ